MRRCMTRKTSSSSSNMRYLPRRATRSILRPDTAASTSAGGAGSHQRASSTSMRVSTRPSTAGARKRLIVSTSGSSGTHPSIGSERLVGRARVRLEVDVLQALARQVRVELRGRDVSVAEHLLHGAQVAAAGKEVRRERVAQGVRAHPVREARGDGVPADDLVEALPRERLAAEVDEEMRLEPPAQQPLATALHVDARGLDGRPPDRNDPLLRALPPCAEHSDLEVDVPHLKRDRL